MGFVGELTSAQLDPANKLCARQRLILGFPQGSGKSVIAIAAAEKLLELNLIKTILILAPTSIAWQWQDRIQEFTDHNDVRLVEAKNKRSRDYGAHSTVYTVIPYSVFRKDSTEIQRLKFDLIIADEAQEFSNFRSKTFKLIKKFKSKYRWALTGTAISNKLEELYAIMEWVDPTFLPSWSKFEKLHIVRNPKTKQILRYKNLDTLHGYLKSKRFERKTIAELQGSLPKLIPYPKYIEKDREVFNAEQDLYNNLVTDDDSVRLGAFDPRITAALQETRKVLSNETKLNYAAELIHRILNEHELNRIVVFSFHKEPLYQLQQLVNGVLFTGDQSSSDKQWAVNQFKEKERVLLCSNAGAAGLDLPFANYVIHLDVPYSFGVMDQRSKRIQRTSSQFESVIVIYLLVKSSIEEYYFKIVSNKGALAAAALEGKADFVLMRPESLTAYLKRHYDP